VSMTPLITNARSKLLHVFVRLIIFIPLPFILLCSCTSAMISFLNELLPHKMRDRPTAAELLKSHPLLVTLVQLDSSPKISNCLPTQRLISKIMTALADDDDVVSSLYPLVGSSKNESFSNQFEAIRSQLGLEKNQVVRSSSSRSDILCGGRGYLLMLHATAL